MAAYPRGLRSILQKHPNDVVFLSALRTPITQSYKGGLRNAYPEQMLAAVLRATLSQHASLEPPHIQDVAVGTVLSELGGSKAARMALNHVGYPSSTSLYTVNRACSSSLQAISAIADSIAVGRINMGVGAGMESMTRNYGSKAIPTMLWPELRDSSVKDARDCIMPMGLTSENVAERYGISRADQDAFGAESHSKASKAQGAGQFDGEIVPVTVQDSQDSAAQSPAKTTEVSKDGGIRPSVSVESMAKLPPVFSKSGTTTAGNSSQISDGAAAALLCRRSTATSLGLSSSILGKFAGSSVVGCAPDEMGVGPAFAIPAILDAMDLKQDDVSIWEINEAFASQALYCIRKLGLEVQMERGKVNPRGGAIALGHPLGATGGRMVSTLFAELEPGRLGVVSMCVGTGMGMAGLFVKE